MANTNENNVLLLFLQDRGYATKEQIATLLEYAETNQIDVTEAIRESGILGTHDEVLQYIAEASGYEFVKLDNLDFSREALLTLDQKQARSLAAIPYALEEGALWVAVPIDRIKSVQLKTDLRRLTKIGIINLVIAPKNDIYKAIDTQYRSDSELANLSKNAISEQETDTDVTEIGEEIGGDSDVVRFVDLVLKQGIKDRASDIHFDPQEHSLVVRYRMDGILQQITEAPTFMIPEIVSRIKIMAELDISKTREPQDGRLSISLGNKIIDFRVATLPGIHGEKIVMRILDNSAAQLGLDDLGFSTENLERFEHSAKKPYGVLLVTGPTGSGKALHINTRIPTPTGWTTIGEIKEGDTVLGSNGKPCTVLAVSELNPEAEMYRVTFSDGQTILADADHQWLVSTRKTRTAKTQANFEELYLNAHKTATKLTDLSLELGEDFGERTAAEIYGFLKQENLTTHYNSAKAVTNALHMTDATMYQRVRTSTTGNETTVVTYPLVESVYLLGKRLREQHAVPAYEGTAVERVTTAEMLEEGLKTNNGKHTNYAVPVPKALQLPEQKLPARPYAHGTNSALSQTAPIFGEYLRGSYQQRLELLQGITDTVGTVFDNGTTELELTNKAFTDSVVELVRSLGIKTIVTDNHIAFTTNLPVSKLPRNLANIKPTLDTDEKWNYITNIEPVEPAPALCIKVDSPDFTYLAGDGFVVTSNSTTLYAALNALNNPTVNIITAEDPVEYQLDGITQVPVRHPLTFEKVLRTVLRADPDIILIGEIRDTETAEIAMKAGMTGHMVFSTLHTNDAATALTRLGDMGVQPFITASTVEAIVSQRLVRRLCAKCKKPGQPTQKELDSIGFEVDETRDGEPTWYQPVGCKACNNSGYKGRMAIHEVLVMTDEIESAVIAGAKAFEINKLAIETGMISLKEDGFRKAAKGLTTINEIMRVVN